MKLLLIHNVLLMEHFYNSIYGTFYVSLYGEKSANNENVKVFNMFPFLILFPI